MKEIVEELKVVLFMFSCLKKNLSKRVIKCLGSRPWEVWDKMRLMK